MASACGDMKTLFLAILCFAVATAFGQPILRQGFTTNNPPQFQSLLPTVSTPMKLVGHQDGSGTILETIDNVYSNGFFYGNFYGGSFLTNIAVLQTNFIAYTTNFYITDTTVSNYFITQVFTNVAVSNYFATFNNFITTNQIVTNTYITNYLVNSTTVVSNLTIEEITTNSYVSNYFQTNIFNSITQITTNQDLWWALNILNGSITNVNGGGVSVGPGTNGAGQVNLLDSSGTFTILALGTNVVDNYGVYYGNGAGLSNVPASALTGNLWVTNAVTGAISNANGAGVDVSGNLIYWPFVGYSNAVNSGAVLTTAYFGNSSNSAIPYNVSYVNVTNSDGSINTIFRKGMNPNVVTGPNIPLLGGLVEQQEFHFVPPGGAAAKEWHWIVMGTNGLEYRFASISFDETNINSSISYALNDLKWGASTGSAPAMQWDIGYASGLPQMNESLNNGSSLTWTYPNGQGVMLFAQDSGSNSRQLMNWDPVNKRLTFINNADIQSVIMGADMWFYNTGLGLQNSPSFEPKWLITANGGVSAGGLTDPGAGNIQATNQITVPNRFKSPTNAPAAGQLLMATSTAGDSAWTNDSIVVNQITVVTNNVTISKGGNYIVTNTISYITNVWPQGPTGVVQVASNYIQNFVSPTACSITGITGKTSNQAEDVLMTFYNIASTNWNLTLQAGIVEASGGTLAVPAGGIGMLWIHYNPQGPTGATGETNAVFHFFPSTPALGGPFVRTIDIPMGAWFTNNCGNGADVSVASMVTLTNSGDTPVFTVNATTTNEIRTRFSLPKDADFTSPIQIHTFWACTGTNSASQSKTNFVVQNDAAAVGPADRLDNLTFGSALYWTNNVSPFPWEQGTEGITSTLTIGNTPATGKGIIWRVRVLGNAAGTTITNVSLFLAHYTIEYRSIPTNSFATPQ